MKDNDAFEVKAGVEGQATAGNGMVRSKDTQTDYSLVLDGPLFERIAKLLRVENAGGDLSIGIVV